MNRTPTIEHIIFNEPRLIFNIQHNGFRVFHLNIFTNTYFANLTIRSKYYRGRVSISRALENVDV